MISLAALLGLLLAAPGLPQTSNPDASAHENGIEHYRAGDYGEAQREFEQAVRAAPDNADNHVWLGRSYGRRAETNSGLKILASYGLARKTLASFQRAVELDAKNLDALESLFTYHLRAPGIVGGDMKQALALAKRIEALDRAAGAQARAAYREAKKNLSGAEALLAEARERDPDHIGLLLSQASFLARRGRFQKSDELFDAALRSEPDNPSVWFARAKAFIRAKRKPRYAEARDLLRRYLAAPLADPDAEPYWSVRKLLREI